MISSRRHELTGAALVATLAFLVFCFFESIESYFFLWDDNAQQFLPFYDYNFRSIFQLREIPWINFHQYSGHAYFAQGQTGVLYPPAYLAVALSRLLHGDSMLAMDLLVGMHGIGGAIALFYLLRSHRIGLALSVVGAIGTMTFPFVILGSRSWVFISYTFLFTPLLLLCFERLMEKPGWRAVTLYALCKTLFVFQGYTHYVIMLSLLEGAYLLSGIFLKRWKASVACISWSGAQGASLLLSLPLLAPQFELVQSSAFRSQALPIESLLAYALHFGTFVRAQIGQFDPQVVFYSPGSIFQIGALTLLLLPWASLLTDREGWKCILPFLLPALIAFFLSTRCYALLSSIPPFDILRWPFKWFWFFLFFGSVALTLFLSVSGKGSDRRGVLLWSVIILINLFTLLPEKNRIPFGWSHLESMESLQPKWLTHPGRVGAVAFSKNEVAPELLGFDYATLAQVDSFGGYDPLVEKETFERALQLKHSSILQLPLTDQSVAELRRWSVRYLTAPAKTEERKWLSQQSWLHLISETPTLLVYELKDSFPYARSLSGSELPITWGINRFWITPTTEDGPYLISIGYRSEYQATDSQGNPLLITNQDGQLCIHLPTAPSRIEVSYDASKYRKWFLLSGTMALILLSGCAKEILKETPCRK